MPRPRTIRKLTTTLAVMLAGGGITLMAAMPAGASTAAAADTSPAVENCGTGAALTQPGSLILTCADHGMVAGQLNWQSWTAAEATATSTVTWAESAPQQDSTTADITLSEPVTQPDGMLLFTQLTMQVTGTTPSGFLHTVTFNEAPAPAPTTSPGTGVGSGKAKSPAASAAASGTLNTAAIGGYWELAGGPSSEAETAEAITGAEASFEPGIIQPGMPYSTTGWGMWQITPGNSVPTDGEDYQLLDPWNNAEAAVFKYGAAGDSFSPWTTYVDGIYEGFLKDAQTPNTNLTDPGQYEPVNSAPSGTHNSSSPGSTYGPSLSTTPQFAYRVVFQANDNELGGYSSTKSNFTTKLGLVAGTSPAVARLSGGTFQAAFEAAGDTLGLSHLGGRTINTDLGMEAGTSPSIAALPGGGWVAAFEDNADQLYLYDSSGDMINTKLGMAAGTNPAIAAGSGGAYRVVFQDNDNVLAGYNSSGSNYTTRYGMDTGSSPALSAAPDGTYEAAFEANNDNLFTAHIGTGLTGNPTNLGMAKASSPSIAVQSDGSFRVVFQNNGNVLAGYNSSGSSYTTKYGMTARTSPSITAEPDGSYAAAFEANNDHLFTVDISSSVSDTGTDLGMDDGTSPAIAY
jgi:hypothetical protein